MRKEYGWLVNKNKWLDDDLTKNIQEQTIRDVGLPEVTHRSKTLTNKQKPTFT